MLLAKQFTAEFIGTALLVFLGVGSVPLFANTDWAVAKIALCFALAVTGSILLLGKISGSHINPAVSIVFWWKKDISSPQLFIFILAQILGGIFGAILVESFIGEIALGTTLPRIGIGATWLLEAVLTCILMLAILVSQHKDLSHTLTALFIGAIVGVEAYLCGPLTGASMNPTRSIAPALISKTTADLWIYISAPITGALVALYISKPFKK